MKRFVIDLKETHAGEIAGRITLPQDGAFVLECLLEVVEQVAKSCGVPAAEIAANLYQWLKHQEKTA